MMDRHDSRRDFLRQSLALGVITFIGGLTACGDGSSDTAALDAVAGFLSCLIA